MGFFAQLEEFLIDGLVRVSTLADDDYVYHESEGALIGERRGRRFRLGDPVVVQIVRADRRFRRLDFLLKKVAPRPNAAATAEGKRAGGGDAGTDDYEHGRESLYPIREFLCTTVLHTADRRVDGQ